MNQRRNFLKTGVAAVSGIVLTGCGVIDARRPDTPPAPATTTSGAAGLTLAGKRAKTIDVHAHCVIPEALEVMGIDVYALYPKTMKGGAENVIVIDQRLAAMDAAGVDVEVLSINPFWYEQNRETSARIVRIQNEKLAQLCAARPDRFAAFASLSLQFPDLAVRELEAAVKMGLRGAAIGGNVTGANFSEPRFHPVWACAERLGATLFIHPTGIPELGKRLEGNGWMANVIAYPLETTIALQHLVFEGVFDKFPQLKVCAAHGGGYFPTSGARMDHGCFVNPGACAGHAPLLKKPSAYASQIYFDSLVFTPEALLTLVGQVGPGQVVLGSDHPFPWQERPVAHVMQTALPDDVKLAILGGNAERMLRLN